jgi:hypothetical protein
MFPGLWLFSIREIAWPLARLQTASDFIANRATHPRKKQGWVATIVEPRRKKDTLIYG